MDITHLGHSSFRIKGKNATLVTDPFSVADTGLKFPKIEADIITVSHSHPDHNAIENIGGSPVVLTSPGEYEIKGVKILGVSSFHDSLSGAERGKNTLFKIKMDGVVIVHLGDLGHKLTERELDSLEEIDLLMIPVGGKYTVEPKTASEIIAQLEPKIIIPMHYAVAGLKFELASVDEFLREMGKEGEKLPKLTISKDKLPEEMKIIILE